MRVVLNCAVALLVAASTTPAQSNPLAALEAERRSLGSLSFTTLIETPKAGGRFSRIEMSFLYAKPNLYRYEMKMGIEGNLVTVCDGEYVWSWHEKTRKLYRQKHSKLVENLLAFGPFEPIAALSTPSLPLSRLFRVDRVDTAARGRLTLTLVPLKRVESYDRIALTLDAAGKTPLAAAVTKRDKLVARITFSNYARNAAIPPANFIFTIPRGVTPSIL